ncbi:ABC transporter substrate-binding protein [Massilia sp. YIM B04103]|uniref:ABC transporter substrate-binding protein n=1 Tax=Massilia sp. YIM B04103 TaxID=2963106 RepID=UPI00210EAFB0|nr:ABC transporter substrate-binding protein [Massilia sp. YIM B04103]
MRIGVCAALQVDSTVHARGFLHGVYLAACTLPGIRRAELLFYDDGASAEGGARAAAAFIEAGVHAVIGHFASASAEAALAHYRSAGLPLLLPASTRAGLTRQGSTALRICASDRVLARHAAALLRGQGLQRVCLAGDDSLHGRSQLEELHEALLAAGLQPLPDWRQAQAGVYCGRLKASRAFLLEQRAAGNALPLYFTDDAASPALTARLEVPGEVSVLSFPAGMAAAALTPCQAFFGASPLLYTLETLAAFAVLEQAAQASPAPLSGPALLQTLREREFASPLGAIRFAAGENLHAQVSLWRHGGGALREHAILAPLGQDTSNQ